MICATEKISLSPIRPGTFGYELARLYEITGEKKYLDAAIKIANTLMKHLQPGDEKKSPLPFRVNAKTGETGSLFDNQGSGQKNGAGTLYIQLDGYNDAF